MQRELGADDKARCAVYRKLFRADIEEAELSALRESVNKGWVLGSERFAKKIAAVTQRRIAPLARGGRRKGAGRPKRDQTEGKG